MSKTPRGLDTLEMAIEQEVWNHLQKWEFLVGVETVTIEKVLRRMADKARHLREEANR